MTSSRIVGPALAGVLITTVGFGWCFLTDALSYVAVIAGLALMRSSELRAAPPATRAKRQVRDGFNYARGTPELWIPLVMMAIIGTFAFNFQVVLPLLATRTFDGGDGLYTAIFSVVSVGSLAGALAMARRNRTSVRHVIHGALAFGVALTLFALAPTLAFVFPIAVVMGFCSMTFMVTSTAIVQMRSDPVMRGRVLALQAIVFLGSTPIGGPIVGAICDAFGARAGLLVGAIAAFVAAGWGLAASRQHADREAFSSARRRPSSTSLAMEPGGIPARSSG
jgi:predicted MFS family arabinose efflux permease